MDGDGEREEQFSQWRAEVYGLECEAANCSLALVVFAVRPTLCSEVVGVLGQLVQV